MEQFYALPRSADSSISALRNLGRTDIVFTALLGFLVGIWTDIPAKQDLLPLFQVFHAITGIFAICCGAEMYDPAFLLATALAYMVSVAADVSSFAWRMVDVVDETDPIQFQFQVGAAIINGILIWIDIFALGFAIMGARSVHKFSADINAGITNSATDKLEVEEIKLRSYRLEKAKGFLNLMAPIELLVFAAMAFINVLGLYPTKSFALYIFTSSLHLPLWAASRAVASVKCYSRDLSYYVFVGYIVCAFLDALGVGLRIWKLVECQQHGTWATCKWLLPVGWIVVALATLLMIIAIIAATQADRVVKWIRIDRERQRPHVKRRLHVSRYRNLVAYEE
jgi:hypothetical protein